MENTHSLIEQYLLGNLSQEETKILESQAESNPALKSEIEFQKHVVEAIKQKKRMELKAGLSQLNPSTSVFTSTLFTKVAITAGVVASGIVAMYYYNADTETNELKSNQPLVEVVVPTIESTQEDAQEKLVIVSDDKTVRTENKIEKNQKVTNIDKPKNDAVIFDPTKQNLKDDELTFTSNGELEGNITEASDIKTSVLQPTKFDESYSFNGYQYDGKNIQMLGKYKKEELAPVCFKYHSKLYMKYEGAYYKIIVSKKEEKLSNHVISDTLLLKKLEALKL